MSLWYPYAFDIFGNPLPPAPPPALRVEGAMLTNLQRHYAQCALVRFVDLQRVSQVPNPIEIGKLPDGSGYRIVVVGNSITMFVQSAGAIAAESKLTFGGVLRYKGTTEVRLPDLRYTYPAVEFKENETQDYLPTTKLYAVETQSSWLDRFWSAFNVTDRTGPMAKWFQWARGAGRLYHQYFQRINKPTGSIEPGIALTIHRAEDGTRRVFALRAGSEGVYAIKLSVSSLPAFGITETEYPQELQSLFGGVPIPPLETDWDRAPLVLTKVQIEAAIGGPAGGTNDSAVQFPTYASTGDAKEHFSVLFTSHDVPGATIDQNSPVLPSMIRGHLIRYSYSLTTGDVLICTVEELERGDTTSLGILPQEHPVGDFSGPVAVTHVNGARTVFHRDWVVREVADTTARGSTRQLVRSTVRWAGGAGGSVDDYVLDILTGVSGSYSAACSSSMTGQYQEVIADSTYYYQLWKTDFSASVSSSGFYPAQSELGAVSADRQEGSFTVSRGERTVLEPGSLVAHGAFTLEHPPFLARVVDPEGTTVSEHQFEAFSTSASATLTATENNIRWQGADPRVLANIPLPGQWVTGIAQLSTPDDWPEEWFPLGHPLETTTTSYKVQIPEQIHRGCTAYVHGAALTYDGTETVRQIEAPHVYDAMLTSPTLPTRHPHSFIRWDHNPKPAAVYFSQLGGKQILVIYEAPKVTDPEQRYRMTRAQGSLVETGYDLSDAPAANAYFVGELQP